MLVCQVSPQSKCTDQSIPCQSLDTRRTGFSSDIRLANDAQQIAIIENYSEPPGTDMSKEDYHERGRFIRRNCYNYQERLLQW